MRSWLDMQALPRERRDKVLPYIRAWVEPGARLTAAEVFDGYSQMGALRDAAVAACQPYDFVLSPVSPVPTYAAEWPGPTNDPAQPLEHIAFTLPYNMSEQPAASIDCGHTAGGLPIDEPQATPVAPLRTTGWSSRPASDNAASAAPTANSASRPMLRNCLRVQCAGGAKSSTGPPSRVFMSVWRSHSGMKRMALRPARMPACTCAQLLPRPQIPLMPVTTTRRISTNRRSLR
jgi:hypothetical protein